MKVTKVIDNFADIAAAIRVLAETRVYAGVPSTKTARSDGPINNAQLMYIHENGTFIEDEHGKTIVIPARPVVKPAIEGARIDINSRLRSIGEDALEGKLAAVDKGFNALGLLAQNAMQERIVEGPFVPLKPATIAARKRAGFRGTKPLIRTGKLKAALTYVIRKTPWYGGGS